MQKWSFFTHFFINDHIPGSLDLGLSYPFKSSEWNYIYFMHWIIIDLVINRSHDDLLIYWKQDWLKIIWNHNLLLLKRNLKSLPIYRNRNDFPINRNLVSTLYHFIRFLYPFSLFWFLASIKPVWLQYTFNSARLLSSIKLAVYLFSTKLVWHRYDIKSFL